MAALVLSLFPPSVPAGVFIHKDYLSPGFSRGQGRGLSKFSPLLSLLGLKGMEYQRLQSCGSVEALFGCP